MKRFLLFLTLLPALVSGQGSIYLRVTEGQTPYTYQLYNAGGTLVETRQSNKAEEKFTAPGYGYAWKVTGADNSSSAGSVDAVTHQLMNKHIRMKGGYYSSPSDFAVGLAKVKNIPGFTTYTASFHAFDLLNTAAKWNDAKWSTPYDHTVPNQTFTQDQIDNTFDQLVYNAYNSGNSAATRMNLRITYDGGLLSNQLSSTGFGYGWEECPKRPDGQYADLRPSNSYLTKYPCYVSAKALAFYKEGFKKFCTRYQKAINDGTIREIGFQLNESGESNFSGGYYDGDANGTWSLSYGDYSEKMRTAFMNFCQARFGSIQTLNSRLGTTIPAFTLDAFNSNMLLNNADGGNDTMQSLWQWYQAEAHDLFEYEMQKYVYDQVPITRTKLFAFDVGSIMNGDMFRMKSHNFAQRLLKYDRWMTVKSNNSHEFGAGPFVIDQILSGAQLAGAYPCWEPSPGLDVFTLDFLTEAAWLSINNGVGLSAFSYNNESKGIESYSFWTEVSNRVNLSAATSTFKPDNLNSQGNPITLTIPFLKIALDGKYNHIGDNYIHSEWKKVADQNPGKHIVIRVDDSDVRALFVNSYPINTTATTSNPNPDASGGGGGED
ncbi:hypothetical protein BWI96_16790 [Siphonobacter sp. SORGH_AS_0500]|uniref:hypothetical protein n=1 Tax=Siphonobacter sp. SORGH_AS_0500 TaxID=1864824 RepID=UPI000CCA0B9F|nr:hypothetical protein [Siphonobacter sp. SORGH_AS_0500]PKK35556.1 hypothetical protein BWI96_16790 [Siphonobacter sp. SORGH_AS_0500]